MGSELERFKARIGESSRWDRTILFVLGTSTVLNMIGRPATSVGPVVTGIERIFACQKKSL